MLCELIYVYSCIWVGVCVCVCVCRHTHVCMNVWRACVGMYMCECVNSHLSLYMVVWYSDTDPFGEIWTLYKSSDWCSL